MLVWLVIVDDCVKNMFGLFLILLFEVFSIKFVFLSNVFMLVSLLVWVKWLIFIVKWLVWKFYVVIYVVYFDLLSSVLYFVLVMF